MDRSSVSVLATGSPNDPPPVLAGATWERRYVLGPKTARGVASITRDAYDLVHGRAVSVEELETSRLSPRTLLPYEVTALASIEHPAVARVYAVHGDVARPFVVRAASRGRELAGCLLHGRLPVARALPLLGQIASALDALHAAGIVHGDVKPANALVRDDFVKVTGVGLAQFLTRARRGARSGTPAYRAPERELAPAGDVYAFGVTCFEVLTGRLPFLGVSPAELLRAHALETPPLASSCAPLRDALDGPLAEALAKRPEDRPASCTAVVDALACARTQATTGEWPRVVDVRR